MTPLVDKPAGTGTFQVDLRAIRAVGIHLVGTRLARLKMKPGHGIAARRGLTIGHDEIDLSELARAIEIRLAHARGGSPLYQALLGTRRRSQARERKH